MSDIRWHPIEQIPAALKDGRELLIWDKARRRGPHHFGWYAAQIDRWLISGSSQHLDPTHYAEINSPTD